MNRGRTVSTAGAVAAVAAVLVAPPAQAGEPAQVRAAGRAEGGAAVSFVSSLTGENEVAAPGDRDGRGLAFLRLRGDRLSFALSYRGVAGPTAAVLQEARKGAEGPVRIPLSARRHSAGKAAESRTERSAENGTVSGTVTVSDRRVRDALRKQPNGFSFNLLTAPFPHGAVRGQLHASTRPLDPDRALRHSVQARVLRGAQVYACTRQSDGRHAFTQRNVRARLEGGIAHFFAAPGPGGPPAWVAPDRSAVTGTVRSRTPNGAGNIPELALDARQAGRPGGRLGSTEEVLRLNTVGGVAPTGTCDPAVRPEVAVPYRADYVFVGTVRTAGS
ncbi:CHRD domain-containing protein [Streptomyces sp. NPDC052496]|uniref:CHRD domain-containing protein n=1 Tax=Streptomyces sp. NPDC052496 TaxID=3154951 RepID=UPI0034473F15